ncbi:patatin-like phospholipase family protein [Massilia horti]|uniref:Patatin n=1 Tax=Massilia horti TaxID=2562153 RepID=A0A4Y9SWY0_9BURK|nr:patatin-like phospholipase family protein [Massilia horti]TFW31188.1 patatin [Massilia horti]
MTPTPLKPLVALVLAACALAPAGAQTPARPRIGLVLGGGGARGAAHIGVLQVLDALRVPVDCVAGTSMGALVSGAYVSGVGPERMLARLARVDWRDLFEDNPSHAETNYRERTLQRSYYPGLEFGVTGRGLRFAHGVVGGQKIKLFLNTLVGADRGERAIESLPLPLSLVATDIGTGEKVVFRSGQLSTAMRASMSVPALLSPVRYQGRNLVDGGLVDNLPVDEVRTHCSADVVIAVDVGSPLSRPQDVDSIVAVTGQMINILAERNSVDSRALLRASDIYIRPDLKGITSADFYKFREGAASGRNATLAQADRLRQYAVPEEQYAAWARRLQVDYQAPPLVDEVQIVGLRHVNAQAVARHLNVPLGQPLDTVRLERGLGRIYGDGDFEQVDYEVLPHDGRATVRILLTEKPWGPDYLRFGVNLEAASKETNVALRAAYHRKWVNALGAEWLSGAQVGDSSNVFTDFYQPLDPRQRVFVEPFAGLERNRFGVFQNDQRIADYIVRQRRVQVNVGTNIGVLGQARLGWRWRKVDTSVETGSPTLPNGQVTLRGWQAILDLDQTDRAFYPTRGWSANVTYFRNNGLDYSTLSSDLRAIKSWDPYVVNVRYSYLNSWGSRLPIAEAGGLGGILNLSGYVRNQILAGDLRFVGVRGEKIIGHMPLGLSGDLRVGLSLEFGRARKRFTETALEGWQQAAALYLGGETPLGPIYFGYGYAKGGRSSLYLFLGLP